MPESVAAGRRPRFSEGGYEWPSLSRSGTAPVHRVCVTFWHKSGTRTKVVSYDPGAQVISHRLPSGSARYPE
jgi:hypothetical protein